MARGEGKNRARQACGFRGARADPFEIMGLRDRKAVKKILAVVRGPGLPHPRKAATTARVDVADGHICPTRTPPPMASRSPRFLGATLMAALVATSLLAGCGGKKAKPEVRLAQTSTTDGGGFGTTTAGSGDLAGRGFGTNSFTPGDAPPPIDGGFGSSVGRGTGMGLDGSFGGAIATDASGSIPNSASTAGIENGVFIADLDMIHFAYDSADITPEWQTILEGHANWLKSNGTTSVQIEGHCDERGTEEYNISLGQRRADAVRQFLIDKGVDPNRLSTISYGKSRPLVFGQNEESHAQNRRAMFLVYHADAGQQVANAQ
jgi:peptidoglycan-associated lipoprotein